ncbi:TetR/AcrR family transcriptional regulator [Halobacillus shinanisalinarum]|uniref:TetR/AcrR family transcriptional regulator n=1 Tax=Halobacillus shinanisalinarum TaxID=2932258 RepID=A0ABY4GU91_9BACI|nr:TetR/AcrR family transcriptional regulator [Halobacillus shinanisalinarum]UOQ91721.1 TetR/AcrR family transcriptional regulator [Halobacillus shinanisalinarum]
MPKQTFFNLKEEKRQTLIDAAKKEFSRVSLYDASISNILKTSGIPRGSFYQYFEDKEDIFFYLLNEDAKDRHEHFVSYLKNYDGDLFETMKGLFQSALEHSQERGKNDFIRNAILNMNYKIENTFAKVLNEETFSNRYMEVYHLVNTKNLNISSERELFHVLQIIVAVTMHNLVHSFARDLPIETAVKNYTTELDLLKKGLCKY